MPVLDLIAWSLLVVWAALLAGGFLFRSSPTSKPPVPAWIQATCSGILLLLAWYGYLLTRAGTDSARYALGIAGGMTFGLVGCLLMTGAVGPRRTLIGFSASALGYLLFIGAMARYGAALESVRWLVLSLWLVAGALAGGIVLTRARRPDPLRASAAVAYTLLLTATAGFATGLALLEPLFGVLGRGGASRTSQRTAYGRGTVCMPVAKCPKTWSRRRAKRLASVMDRQRSPFTARARPCPDRRFYLVGAPGFRLTLAHSSFPFVAFSAIITRNENLLANRHIQPTKRHVYQHIPLRPGNRMAAES